MNTKQIIRIAQLTFTAAAALTELARVTGQAMLLHETGDGRTLLYIEQNHGARLAIFDVSDPAHVKQEQAAQLEASGSFDFVSSLGDRAELVRFRNGQGEAVLDLHKAKVPTLKMVQGLNSEGSMERLGDDGFILASQPNAQAKPSDPNYQVVQISNSLQIDRVADVQHVREKITNRETGTTFLLTADGLYLIRRPAVEEEYKMHEYQMSHPG